MRIGLDRRLFSLIVALGSCALAWLVLAGASASGAITHQYLSQLTGFGNPSALAVDTAGDVYVVDTAARTVDRFSSAGVPLAFSASGSYIEGSKLTGIPSGVATEHFAEPHGVAVDDENGLVYVSDGALHVVDVFSSTGEYLRQITGTPNTAPVSGLFQDPYGMTVDQVTHRLYVTDPHSEVVDVFNATGAYLSQFGSGVLGTSGPWGESIAVNELTEDAYVGNPGPEAIDVFDRLGSFLPPAWTGTGTPAKSFEQFVYIGMDPATGHVYLAETGGIVNEFNASTSEEYLGQLTEAPTGAGKVMVKFSHPQAVAVDPTNGDLYVADAGAVGVVDIFGPDVSPPSVTEAPISNLGTATVTFNGAVNPSNEGNASCRFEYGETESYGLTIPCSPSPGSGGSPVSVTANVTGLKFGTTYHYRLVATNIIGTTSSQDQQFTTHGPTLNEFVENVFLNIAKLGARIDPNGADTTYHFEYDTDAYENSASHGVSLPALDADIGSGSDAVSVSVQPQQLQPGTTYHYRLVLVSEVAPGEHEAFDGPDRTFTTPSPMTSSTGSCANEQMRSEQPYALDLPDCRAYEMVSPLDKDDNGIARAGARASTSGDAITYFSKGAFANPAASMFSDRYISRRGSGGWPTQNITPRYHTFNGNTSIPFSELLFTPDLSKGLLTSEYQALTSGSPAGYINLYVADTNDGSYEAVTGPPPGVSPYRGGEGKGTPLPVGVSTDLSHVVFQFASIESHEALTPEASPGRTHIYEWAAGKLSLVDIPPEGMTFEAEDNAGAPGGEPALGDVWHAVSADGSRVFFTAGEATGSTEKELGQVYVREIDQARTIEISASQKTNGKGPGGTDEDGPRPARYWDASTDGSRVFFTSRSELTNDANTGVADDAANLYEYDLETGVLSDLTVDRDAGDVEGAKVLGLATASEDGAYVYFVAEGDLAEGAKSGRPNLYLYHAGKVTFIATLAPATSGSEPEGPGQGDRPDWMGAQPQAGFTFHSYGPASHTARVSADGTRLAFQSELSLTGYDNEPVESQECESGRCREVYMYDARSEALTCVSCDPSGAQPIGSAELGGHEVDEAEGFGSFYVPYLPRNFSDDGNRLFLESLDPLVPHDSNGQKDVYEYEDGRVYPISDVAASNDSRFMDASASGDDVFITTAAQLLPSDTDFRTDLYDVRVGGGLPVSTSPPECVNGDSCKGPVSAQPGVFGAPASATFSGAGNISPARVPAAAVKAKAKVKPRRCRKRYVNKRGRCVKGKPDKSAKRSKKGRR